MAASHSGPAQDELLRLALVAQAAETLAATRQLESPVGQSLRSLSLASDTAIRTISGSLTASLLLAQRAADRRAEASAIRSLQGQQRLAAGAAALVLPTIVVGYAGANFVAPAASDRYWSAGLTAGLALIAFVTGGRLAWSLLTAPQANLRRYLLGLLVIGTLLVLGSVVSFWWPRR